MESLAYSALLVLALVGYANYRAGTLGQWARTKFLGLDGATATAAGSASPSSSSPAFLGAGAGSWVTPVAGRLSSPFGAPRDGGARKHAGVDLAVPTGTPVAAARAGRVIFTGTSGDYGLRVDVDHGGGFVTRYAHLSRIKAERGQDVAAGATLGLSGSTGESTGPHLHFEVRQNGLAIDPLRVVSLAESGGFG